MMKHLKPNEKLSQKLLPFCAGIAFGVSISISLFVLLYASTTIFDQFLYNENEGLYFINTKSSDNNRDIYFNQEQGENDVIVRERKLSQDVNSNDLIDKGSKSIPNEVKPDPVPEEDPDWEAHLTPLHIPGHLTNELLLKKKVFVAIINPSVTSDHMMELLQNTWAKDWIATGNGDITIYATTESPAVHENGIKFRHLSVQTKNSFNPSIAMIYQALLDICDQHIDTHHHFFVANSNTYTNLPRLLNFTKRLDEAKALWIGKRMETNPVEKFYTNDPEIYCATGPGFILSRNALQMLCPRLANCQREYHSDNVEAGLQLARCLQRFVGITCTSSEKDLFHETKDTTLESFDDDCPHKESISVHPVSDETSLLKLHYLNLAQQLNETKGMNEYYHNIIQNMDRVLVQERGMADDRLILGRNGNSNKFLHGDVITWDLIESVNGKIDRVYTVDNDEPSRELTDADITILKRVKEVALKQMQDEHGKDESLSAGNMFRRVVPGVGYQYMVDIHKYNQEIATVCVDQPYDRMRALSTQLVPDVVINFVLPIKDGSPHFQEFMQLFEQACMSADRAEKVSLLIILYIEPSFEEQNSETLLLLNVYKKKYPSLSLRWINAKVRPFSHIEAIAMAVQALHTSGHDHSLICSTNAFTKMSPEFLHRARLNTVLGERLFFPVPFQQLKSTDVNDEEVSKSNGFWRSFDYSLFCGYRQDITRACGGGTFASGVDLYDQALQSGLDVFRAPEHFLTIRWHERNCQDSFLSKGERNFCEKTSKHLYHSANAVLR